MEKGTVMPVFKEGDRTKIVNYRPHFSPSVRIAYLAVVPRFYNYGGHIPHTWMYTSHFLRRTGRVYSPS
ncbi:hypothetical protein J437_LFUL017192 [Ladona fulva]|uniref:Uncharacterized protein n=1 Tax=Ladona fulva TaxID=123851 RepID=A0A8K0PAE4_LADFU|nr:hypothetical protein J437_LFUL017192 [Ladona fulva]